MTSTATTTSPTEITFYANHTTEAIRSIQVRMVNDSLYMQLHGGEALATEALKIAAACYGALILRGEG